MPWEITAEEIQRTFDLVYPLHPNLDVAFRVTMDACDVLSSMKERQARRQRSGKHYKIFIPADKLLQFAVYYVSDYRERDQESPRPLLQPFYKPTRDDLIVRFVKHLIWKTTELNYCYVAVGLGCLLYSYSPREIADLLGLFDENNFRHVKMRIARKLKERFAHFGLLTPRGAIRTKAPSEPERSLVHDALITFTPWKTTHFVPASKEALILATLFNRPNLKSQWGVYHTLIDPVCGGIERLVNEYSGYLQEQGSTKLLADPLESLLLPDFPDIPTPPLQRFKRRLLTESEKMLLSERHKPTGPWVDDLEEYLESLGLGADLLEDTGAASSDLDQGGRVGVFLPEPNVRILDFAMAKSIGGEPAIEYEPDAPLLDHTDVDDDTGNGGDGTNEAVQTPATRSITEDPPAHSPSADRKHTVFFLAVGGSGEALRSPLEHALARDGGDTPMVIDVDEFEAELEPLLELCKKVARRATAFHQTNFDVDDLIHDLFLQLWKRSERPEFEVATARRWLVSVTARVIKQHRRHHIRDLMEQEQQLILERRDAAFKLSQADTMLDGRVYVTGGGTRRWQDYDIAVVRLLKVVAPEKRGVLDVISLHRKELSKYMVSITPVFAWKAHSHINHPRKLAGDVPVVKNKKTNKKKQDTKRNGHSMVKDNIIFRSTNTLTLHRYGRGKAREQQLAPAGWKADRSPSVNHRGKFEFLPEECDQIRKPNARPPQFSMKFVCDLLPRSKPTNWHVSPNRPRRAYVLTLPLLSPPPKTRERAPDGRHASERVEPEACLVTVDLASALTATVEGSNLVTR